MLHGLVCDGQGKKMSKSRGNVVDPLNVITGRSIKDLEEDFKITAQGLMSDKDIQKTVKVLKTTFPSGIPKCGTDALRFSLVHNDPKSQQVNVDVNFIYTCAAFCNKIWQATRFFLLSHEKVKEADPNYISNIDEACNLDWIISNYDTLRPEDKWILSQYATTVKDVNCYLEKRDFHLVARSLRSFLYTNLCDVYVEASKPSLLDTNRKDFKVKYAVLKVLIMDALKLLHPIMPYITEELYQRILFVTSLQTSKDICQSIMVTRYPKDEDWESFINENITNDMECVLEVVSDIRNTKKIFNLKRSINPNTIIVCDDESHSVNLLDQNKIIEVQELISTLSPCGNVVIVSKEKLNSVAKSDNENIVQNWWKTDLESGNITVYLDTADFIDVEQELNKISSQRKKTLENIETLNRQNVKLVDNLTNAKIDSFNSEIGLLNERELFLKKIKRKYVL